MKPDIEIAREAAKKPIGEVAAMLGIPLEAISPYGGDKAKISLDYLDSLAQRPDGRLILMTGISPTPAGEGKTTTLVGLNDALNRLGHKAVACLREPSLGPCFGMKGGATGGGMSQLTPMDDINLHFTGDFHAITAANNLLAAMLDNHIHWGGEPVYSRDLEAVGAMTVLLRQAMAPNLVQTLENNPALVHGGPFANIAHGCNSIVATRASLKLADYVVSEAGFGADLGAEKFFNIKCRVAGLQPAAAVVVATVRALKMHGGVARADLAKPDVAALAEGMANLRRHVQNVGKFGVPVVVALNRFDGDTPQEIDSVQSAMAELGVEAVECSHWADGGRGAEKLAGKVRELADSGKAAFKPIYPDDLSLADKIRAVAREIYGAADVDLPAAAAEQLRQWEAQGRGHLPVCIAKTQYSFSSDPTALGAPSGHTLPVREVRLFNGAGFIVVITGNIMTMPALPREPAANHIRLDADRNIVGLF